MTRAQLEGDVRTIMNESFGLGRRMGACQRVYDHDAEQREEIARLQHEYRQLKEAYHAKASGVPLGPIIGAQTIINQQQEIARLRAALQIYKEASIQSHNGHWDATGNHGAGCPECIRARELRSKAENVLAQQALKENV